MNKMIDPIGIYKCLGCQTCAIVCAAANRGSHSIEKSAIKIRTSGGMTGRFVAVVCRACADPACMNACPVGALEARPGGGVLLNPDKCIGCRKCVPVCGVEAVNFDEDTSKPIICHHCGICATFCTHNCIVVKKTEEAQPAGKAEDTKEAESHGQ